MNEDLNPRAFPDSSLSDQPGMTLRDYFAGQVITGLLASGTWANCGDGFDAFIADATFNIADAMLARALEGAGR